MSIYVFLVSFFNQKEKVTKQKVNTFHPLILDTETNVFYSILLKEQQNIAEILFTETDFYIVFL